MADAVAPGRDPRSLGEVLIGRLRDAFLAVMKAPDRHLPAADLARAEALGAELGAAGLTRALEVLGEALVELAKKPDPRIVLEVALVRLCRPDADRSYDAILDRLERLERGAAAPPSAPVPAAGWRPWTPTRRRRPSTGPAAAARDELAQRGGPPGPRAPVKKAASRRHRRPRPERAVAPAAPAGGRPTPTRSASTPTTLQAAWPVVVDGLKGATRGMFRDGRFEVADDGAVVLVVPKGPPADQLEKRRPEVEAALADAASVGPCPCRSSSTRTPTPALGDAAEPAGAGPAEEEVIDVHALEDAPAAGRGVDRLAEAFPGAELVEE